MPVHFSIRNSENVKEGDPRFLFYIFLFWGKNTLEILKCLWFSDDTVSIGFAGDIIVPFELMFDGTKG